uniref:ARAD1D14322p n=1 Tax=Blastobotrys adeninivorans TaxID=409370 RepID=A0A060T9C3_BLAAD
MPTTLRSVSKAFESVLALPSAEIDQLLQNPKGVELPSDTINALQTFAENTDVESPKIHEELLRIHKTSVASKSDPRLDALFAQCLTYLLGMISSPEHVKFWFSYLAGPAFDSAGQLSVLIKACRDAILAALTTEHTGPLEASIPDKLCAWILDIYLGDTSLFDEDRVYDKTSMKSQERYRFIRRNAKDVLIQYGLKRTKVFLTSANARVVDKSTRVNALVLLSSFVSMQSPNLYQILDTPLLESIFQCLIYDTSSTALSICANTLAMLLPHICNTMGPRVPMLFAIYGRLACWHLDDELIDNGEEYPFDHDNGDNQKEGPDDNKDTKDADEGKGKEKEEKREGNEWEPLGPFFGNQLDDRKPSITPLFTFLYGLFPANMVSFLKKPSKYLTKANYTRPFNDFWDEPELLAVSKPIFELHVLHPGIISNSPESEISDDYRWRLMGSATDIASLCLSYYNQSTHTSAEPSTSPEFKIPFATSDDSVNEDSIVSEETNKASRESLEGGIMSDSAVYDSLRERASLSPKVVSADRAVVTPTMQDVDRLLEEHGRLYTRRDGDRQGSAGKKDSISTIPEELNLNDQKDPSSATPVGQQEKPDDSPGAKTRPSVRTGTLTSPGFHPVTGAKSPTLSPLTQASTPSGHLTALTVEGLGPSPRADTGSLRRDSLMEKYLEVESSLSFYQREFLLLKNELDFVSFIEQQSQYKFKMMRKELAKKVVNDESVRRLVSDNSDLRKKLEKVQSELELAQKNAKTYRNDRQKYENEIIKKSREFRQNGIDLTAERDKLQQIVEDHKTEKDNLAQRMIAQETRIASLELDLEYAQEKVKLLDSYQATLEDTKTELFRLKEERDDRESNTMPLQMEVSDLRKRIESLNLDKESLRREIDKQGAKYRKIIDDLRAKITQQESRSREPTAKVTEMIDQFRQASDTRYNRLKTAHDELSQRYMDLNNQFRNFMAAHETSQARPIIQNGNSVNPSANHNTSLLGFDMDNNQHLLRTGAATVSESNFHSPAFTPLTLHHDNHESNVEGHGPSNMYRGIPLGRP